MRNNKLIIIGAGGHGKAVAEVAVRCGYDNIAFLDDNLQGKYCMGFPVEGKVEDYKNYKDYNFFVAIGNYNIRKNIMSKLDNIVTLIDPNAIVSRWASLGSGCVVEAGAIIRPDTNIGKGCIINSGATISHDNKIGDFVHLSGGSHLAGTVTIGENTFIGIGACVKNNINITSESIIGAGAVVVSDIVEKGTYVGCPAKKITYRTAR